MRIFGFLPQPGLSKIIATGTAAVAVSLGLAVSPAQAGIISSFNVNVIAPPPSVAKNALVGTNAFVFTEKTGFTTTANVTMDAVAPGTYGSDPGNPVFLAGQTVDSYYLHFDLVSGATSATSGSVTFDTSIIGVIGNVTNLLNSHGQLGAAGTIYWTSGAQGIWDSGGDQIGITGNTVTYSLTIGSAIDSIRIVTAPSSAISEPAGLAILGLGLAGLVIVRRKRAT